MDTDSRDSASPAPAIDPGDRSLAEQALRLSEQSYRLLIEEAPYAICRATETGQLLQVNRSMLEMLGYPAGSEADLLIRDLPQIFVDAEGFSRFCQSIHGDTVQGLESRWLCRDGRHIQVRIGARRVHGSARETLYFDLIAENVTERKELEAMLARAEKMQAIGQLAGGIAHDFNNLLTVINGYCDLLLAGKGGAQQRQYLEMVRQAGERALGLTQQLLAFSRKQLTRAEAVDINSIVTEVLRLSRRVIGENIRVAEDLCEPGATVMADASQIHQMLMNLVINARDAMPEGGDLRIATSVEELSADLAGQFDLAPGPYIVLTVTDSGVGMDDFVRAHIFEPFFTTKDVGKGTGLGLSTVYGTVRQSHGAIDVESRPGEGATFRIYLPKGAPPECPAGDSEAQPKPHPTACTVLVVEDEDAVRRLITDLLRRDGHHVLEASNAHDAMILASRHRDAIHLLVTDMVMPGASGRELADSLRLLHPDAKVLLVSGYSESLNSDGPLDDSILYLPKPFTPEHLTRVVREAIA
jgi:two-component system, cell cycle sensor histidine kinase and response regulator CckA